MTNLEAALAYASWGWPVLPIVAGGKLPATAHGVHDATTDEETIRRWFSSKPDLNLGIATGSRSGLIVFDIDPRNGGSESWDTFLEEHGALPDGATQLTAGGGLHHLAEYVEGVRSCKLRDGVDLLADGRYFVAWPSRIGERGYEWELSSSPVDGVAPFVVPERWRPSVVAPVKSAPLVAGAELITGNRNSGLTALAGAMRWHGMSAEEILAALTVANETRCEVPLPASEVRHIARSVARYEPEHDTAANGALADQIAEGLLPTPTPAEAWLIPADDFSAQPAPISWLVRGWWQADALIMVHGPSGGGKTFVALDMALTMAAGRDDWHGARVHPGPVVYLAGEGHAGLRGRIAAWKQARGASRLEAWLSRAGCDLDTPEGYLRVVEAVRALAVRPRVIIVDTLHRFLSGDENSSQDARRMLEACARLMAEFGCSVVLVHHTGVNEEAQHRARGSSAWRGALDIEISVIPGKDGGPMQVVQRKSKDAELCAPIFGELRQVTIAGWVDEDGQAVTSAVFEMAEAEAPREKIDSAVATARKTFEAAWWSSGCELRSGAPYVSRSALRESLKEKRWAESTIKQALKPSGGKLVQILVDGDIIAPCDHGWIVCNETHKAFLLGASERKN